MTNELEKQFFDTFGIPRLCTSQVCEHWGDCEGCLMYPDFALDYPQISDTHYLKLICILNKFDTEFIYFYQEDINVLKETILEDCLEMVCKLRQDKFEQFKHQVLTLFKEG